MSSIWQPVVIILLVIWAIYHSFAEAQQDKRIDRLEREIKKERD